MLASGISLFGPVLVCLVVYLRWQLGDAGTEALPSGIRPDAGPLPATFNPCSVAPSLGGAAIDRACAEYAAPSPPQEPAPAFLRAPGVYVDAMASSASPGTDPTSRGRWLAERIIQGGPEASEPPRRGKKGALDVIVVGANLLGISATVRLMQAGLRVLLVDRQSWAAQGATSPRLTAARPDGAGRTRLPLVTGHHVVLVARRADSMLELQAECAGWYTANVIFASQEAAAPLSEGLSGLCTPIVACAPTTRAA